jgi:hypothetical protein
MMTTSKSAYKLRLEQRAGAALHGRAMALMAIVAPPGSVDEEGSDDHLKFRGHVKGLEVGGGPLGSYLSLGRTA